MKDAGEPANYEPDPKDSFESLANLSNMTAEEIAYDAMLEKEGRALIYHPLFNYQTGDLSLVEKMLKHPYTISGLGDAGAHCGEDGFSKIIMIQKHLICILCPFLRHLYTLKKN